MDRIQQLLNERAQASQNHAKQKQAKETQNASLKQFSIQSLIGENLSKNPNYQEVKKKNRECSLYMVVDDSIKPKIESFSENLLKQSPNSIVVKYERRVYVCHASDKSSQPWTIL